MKIKNQYYGVVNSLAKDIDIVKRTFDFAVNIIGFAEKLSENHGTDKIIAQQVLRCGTSVGANVEEAQAGESRADFIHKLKIALKEARETNYWLRLISQAKIVSEKDVDFFIKESDEILRVISQIIINSQKNSKSVE